MDNIVNYNEFFKLLKNYTHIFYKNLLQRYNDNPKYFEFIYLKGMFLLKNIYCLLFFNCENINEIILITEKAYIYFIEFLIQININTLNLELSLNDAIIFTYKKTLLSFNKQTVSNNHKINKDLDNYLNILCNIFYIIDNRNFIHDNEKIDDNYINIFITRKINNINKIERKFKNLLLNSINICELNNILATLKDNISINNIEMNIEMNNDISNDISNSNTTKKIINNNILNKITYLFDNYNEENTLVKNKSFNNLYNIL